MSSPIIVAPSLLAADFSRLGDEIRKAESAGADWLHLDVMDGHFVTNISFGIPVVEAARKATELFLDTHLMIDEPLHYAEAFAKAGSDRIIFHVESCVPPRERVRKPKGWSLPGPLPQHGLAMAREICETIRGLGKAAGVALNPETPASAVRFLSGDVDLFLVMSVWPGFGGQKFMEEILPKVREIRTFAGSAHIEVDGGVSPATIGKCREAGADAFVAGTAVFREPDAAVAVKALRDAAI